MSGTGPVPDTFRRFFTRMGVYALVELALLLTAGLLWAEFHEQPDPPSPRPAAGPRIGPADFKPASSVAAKPAAPQPHAPQPAAEAPTAAEPATVPAPQPAPPPPAKPEKVTVRIIAAGESAPILPGEQPAVISHVIGEPLVLSLKLVGDWQKCDWEIDPPIQGVRFNEDRSELICGTAKPGLYKFRVLVVGKGYDVARHATNVTFQYAPEVVAAMNKPAVVREVAAKPSRQETRLAQPASENPKAALAVWLGRVDSPSKADDKLRISQIIRIAASTESLGMLTLAHREADETLGAAAGHWQDWWRDVEKLFVTYEAEGRLDKIVTRQGAMRRLAESLEGK